MLVTGTVGDNSATVYVNGIQAAVIGNSYQATVPLMEGPNTLAAVATNSNGTTTTVSRIISLDTTPPHVTIYSPLDNGNTTDSSVTVTGLVNDAALVTIQLRLARDPVGEREPDEHALPVDPDIRDRVALVADEIRCQMGTRFPVVAARDKERGAENLCRSRDAPAVRIIRRESRLRARHRQRRCRKEQREGSRQSDSEAGSHGFW